MGVRDVTVIILWTLALVIAVSVQRSTSRAVVADTKKSNRARLTFLRIFHEGGGNSEAVVEDDPSANYRLNLISSRTFLKPPKALTISPSRFPGKRKPAALRRLLNRHNSIPAPDMLRSIGPPQLVTHADQLREDFCQTVPFKQKVRHPGCKSQMVVNRFCYGQCNTFFVPNIRGKAAFQTCAFCKPSHYRTVTVTLVCPGLSPPFKDVSFQRIDSCRCTSESLEKE